MCGSQNIDWVDAALIEPTFRACHGVNIDSHLESEALFLDARRTGLVQTQVLGLESGVKVIIAATERLKLNSAKGLDVADEYVKLSLKDFGYQLEQLKKGHPCGFGTAIEATQSLSMLEQSIDQTR